MAYKNNLTWPYIDVRNQKTLNSYKKRVKELSRKTGTSFNLLWKQLVLERFFARVSRSKHRENLVFKGGFQDSGKGPQLQKVTIAAILLNYIIAFFEDP